eukprot:3941043-Rhodomonas_salina.1
MTNPCQNRASKTEPAPEAGYEQEWHCLAQLKLGHCSGWVVCSESVCVAALVSGSVSVSVSALVRLSGGVSGCSKAGTTTASSDPLTCDAHAHHPHPHPHRRRHRRHHHHHQDHHKYDHFIVIVIVITNNNTNNNTSHPRNPQPSRTPRARSTHRARAHTLLLQPDTELHETQQAFVHVVVVVDGEFGIEETMARTCGLAKAAWMAPASACDGSHPASHISTKSVSACSKEHVRGQSQNITSCLCGQEIAYKGDGAHGLGI